MAAADAAVLAPSSVEVRVGIALTVAPADADVVIDERARGKASSISSPVALEPGLHTLVVSRRGYKTYRAEFSVTDKMESFVVTLDSLR